MTRILRILLLFLMFTGVAECQKMPKVLIVVTQGATTKSGTPVGLWLEEFAIPFYRFRQAGVEIDTVTLKGGPAPIDPRSAVKGGQAEEWKLALDTLSNTKALSSVDLDAYDAIFLPGGHGVMFDLPRNPELAKALYAFDHSDRIIAAVCHGPGGLVGAKGRDGKALVDGKTVTCFSDDEERAVKLEKEMPFMLETELRKEGANVVVGPNFRSHSLRSGNLVTGQNPASSAATAELVMQILRERGKL